MTVWVVRGPGARTLGIGDCIGYLDRVTRLQKNTILHMQATFLRSLKATKVLNARTADMLSYYIKH